MSAIPSRDQRKRLLARVLPYERQMDLARLTRNLGWKLSAFGLAVLLWLAVAGEPELVAIQSVPVLLRNLRPRCCCSPTLQIVRAELRGPSGRLTRATLSDAFAALDLAGVVSPGDQTFTLSAADFSLPQGVRFVRALQHL